MQRRVVVGAITRCDSTRECDVIRDAARLVAIDHGQLLEANKLPADTVAMCAIGPEWRRYADVRSQRTAQPAWHVATRIGYSAERADCQVSARASCS
jgi:hypothetical protein